MYKKCLPTYCFSLLIHHLGWWQVYGYSHTCIYANLTSAASMVTPEFEHVWPYSLGTVVAFTSNRHVWYRGLALSFSLYPNENHAWFLKLKAEKRSWSKYFVVAGENTKIWKEWKLVRLRFEVYLWFRTGTAIMLIMFGRKKKKHGFCFQYYGFWLNK